MLNQGSRYKQIAMDIAKQIVEGHIAEGVKIKGRSVLAGSYHVSPETIRKAIALLEASRVVQVIPGSGIKVLSKEKAKEFMAGYNEKEKMAGLKRELRDLLDQKGKLDDKITVTLKEIAEYSLSIYNEYSQFLFMEISVSDSVFLNKSVANSRFWEETGGTIVAIRRGERLLISPDPNEILLEEDVIVYIKDKGSYF